MGILGVGKHCFVSSLGTECSTECLTLRPLLSKCQERRRRAKESSDWVSSGGLPATPCVDLVRLPDACSEGGASGNLKTPGFRKRSLSESPGGSRKPMEDDSNFSFQAKRRQEKQSGEGPRYSKKRNNPDKDRRISEENSQVGLVLLTQTARERTQEPLKIQWAIPRMCDQHSQRGFPFIKQSRDNPASLRPQSCHRTPWTTTACTSPTVRRNLHRHPGSPRWALVRWVLDEAYENKNTPTRSCTQTKPQKRDAAQKRLRNRLQPPTRIHRRDPTVEQEEEAKMKLLLLEGMARPRIDQRPHSCAAVWDSQSREKGGPRWWAVRR